MHTQIYLYPGLDTMFLWLESVLYRLTVCLVLEVVLLSMKPLEEWGMNSWQLGMDWGQKKTNESLFLVQQTGHLTLMMLLFVVYQEGKL